MLWEVLVAEHTIEGGAPTVEPLREEEEEDQRRGSSSAGGLVPWRVPVLEWAMPMGPGFWHLVQGLWVVRWGLPASSKAWGKAPAVVPTPPEMDKKLAWWL